MTKLILCLIGFVLWCICKQLSVKISLKYLYYMARLNENLERTEEAILCAESPEDAQRLFPGSTEIHYLGIAAEHLEIGIVLIF